MEDLEHLKRLAQQWLADIEDDVRGTRLERPHIAAEFRAKIASSRWIQIRGLPGSGKSVVIRRFVETELVNGPVLFLKSGRLEGTGWASFARANGLSNANLIDLLVELGATGSSTLYIDGIDRIEKVHQPIILDLVRAIVDNPLLDNWRIAVTLRDTGIEPLRNWLSHALSQIAIGTVIVEALDDDEADVLANAMPHLRPLLFGGERVREIVRRPFFAKVLSQNFGSSARAVAFQPQSEVDLVSNWWERGGYDSTGQDALERQRAIIELGGLRAKHLDRDIAVRDLSAITLGLVAQLAADGILQHVKQGHSLRFAHDIFFEWAFFHVLTDADDWLKEIGAFGEPPAMARVVELLSQSEFGQTDRWTKTLHRIETSQMRSQWTRAWLLAPLALPNFELSEAGFASAVARDDHRLLKKALVWFQAERTTPSPIVLEQALPQEQRIRVADLLGWPSDVQMWSRFIAFLLSRITTIPVVLYPDVLSVFDVWQNEFGRIRNRVSDALLDQVASWLVEVSAAGSTRLRRSLTPSPWATLGSSFGHVRQSLESILFRSSEARPDLTKEYLTRTIDSLDPRQETFKDIVIFSPILARSHPGLVTALALKHLCEELPEARRKRERQEFDRLVKQRQRARAKSPEKRSRADQLAAEGFFIPVGADSFGHLDWDSLGVRDDLPAYFPPSPLREPFHSLFASAPDEALRLLAELSNHAMTAWRQLHRLADDTPGTPIPLDINFPWGEQRFWGGNREYLWCRSTWAPHPLGCGYLALEEWVFGELKRGTPVDELIQRVVTGNECIAALGSVAMIALQTETVSEAVFSLITSQRLLDADHNRMFQDRDPSVNLIGFTGTDDHKHVQAIRQMNARPARHRELGHLIPRFFFTAAYQERLRSKILDFVNVPPFELEEHRSVPAAQKHLRQSALIYAEMVDIQHYRRVRPPDYDDDVIIHVSPSANSPEQVARSEEAQTRLREGALWAWASKFFSSGHLSDEFSPLTAIEFARSLDNAVLFQSSSTEVELIDVRRGAVAAAAAVGLARREGLSAEHLEWARDVIKRARSAPEERDPLWSPQSKIPWHPALFVARGLAAEVREDTADTAVRRELLTLVGHSLEIVSFAALEAALSLWEQDPKLGWSALYLALSACVLLPSQQVTKPIDDAHVAERVPEAVEKAIDLCNSATTWTDLPLPPAPWVKVQNQTQVVEVWDDIDEPDNLFDTVSSTEQWAPSPARWDDRYAAQVIARIPFERILTSTARRQLLDLLSGLLAWTQSKVSPPGRSERKRRDRDSRLFEWTHALGDALGTAAGFCAYSEVETLFLSHICELEDDRSLQLLSPFVATYICVHIYDAKDIHPDAAAVLNRCLDRFLQSPAFDPNAHRSGELSGFDQPRLAKALMFIGLDETAAGATRYANGNWNDIDRILPVIDRFIRSAGWVPTIMAHFLTLCERARDAFPADRFTEQMLQVMEGSGANMQRWRGTLLPARISGLVQHFADRESPMPLKLGQKFLRILDLLVDMGDRRSAALQLSESFREIQTASSIGN